MWNYISLLSSIDNAKKFLESKSSKKIDPKLLSSKAEGLSFCISSAQEYFQTDPESNLTTHSLMYYYGTLSLLSALLVADVGNKVTLEHVQKFTKLGHGLKMIEVPGCPAPHSLALYLTSGGFLINYLKSQDYLSEHLSSLIVNKSIKDYKDVTSEDEDKLICFNDLIKRIPELLPLYDEIYDEWPLYINFELDSLTIAGTDQKMSKVTLSQDNNCKRLSEKMIFDILPELVKIGLKVETDNDVKKFVTERIEVEKLHKITTLEKYHSVLAETVYIKPLKTVIDDPLIIHFMLLYLLSILVRYQPFVWRNIMSGVSEPYRPLIAQYLRAVERIVPNLFINKLYSEVHLFAPHSYLG